MKLEKDQEIMKHRSHPHSIVGHEENHDEMPYRCDGCLEVGFGSGFRCDPCNFDLHRECAEATSFTTHRFFGRYVFEFMERAPGARSRYCDACGRDVKGFVYHCQAKGWDLHPCCARLLRLIANDEVELHLKEKASSTKCHRCGEKKHRNNASGWWYVSAGGEFKFHVACIKDMAVEEWERQKRSNGNGAALSSERRRTPLVVGSSESVLPLRIARRRGNGTGGFGRYTRILKLVVNVIFSILVGDPTGLLAGLVTSLLTN